LLLRKMHAAYLQGSEAPAGDPVILQPHHGEEFAETFTQPQRLASPTLAHQSVKFSV